MFTWTYVKEQNPKCLLNKHTAIVFINQQSGKGNAGRQVYFYRTVSIEQCTRYIACDISQLEQGREPSTRFSFLN